MTIPLAAVTTAAVGVPQARGHLSVEVLVEAALLALLLPILSFAFELLALREISASAFGTLMALEPAMGVLLGLLVLGQQLTPLRLAGVLLVVVAGAGAQGGGRRLAGPIPPGNPHP